MNQEVVLPFRVYFSKPVFRVWWRVKTGYPVYFGFGKSLRKHRVKLELMLDFQILFIRTFLRTPKVVIGRFSAFFFLFQIPYSTKIYQMLSKLAIFRHFWKPVFLCIKTGFSVLQKLIKNCLKIAFSVSGKTVIETRI